MRIKLKVQVSHYIFWLICSADPIITNSNLCSAHDIIGKLTAGSCTYSDELVDHFYSYQFLRCTPMYHQFCLFVQTHQLGITEVIYSGCEQHTSLLPQHLSHTPWPSCSSHVASLDIHSGLKVGNMKRWNHTVTLF